jgi:hypothetical protein
MGISWFFVRRNCRKRMAKESRQPVQPGIPHSYDDERLDRKAANAAICRRFAIGRS